MIDSIRTRKSVGLFGAGVGFFGLVSTSTEPLIGLSVLAASGLLYCIAEAEQRSETA